MSYDASMYELMQFRKQMEETEKLPLAERKANAVEWFRALNEDHMGVAQKVGWLLEGNYGGGSFGSACRVLASPRMNQVAWCAITIANLEWRCPAKFAIQAWKKMPVEKRYLANQAIRQAIEDAKREGYCGEIKKNPPIRVLSKEKISNITGSTRYTLSNGFFISYEPKRYRQWAQGGFRYVVLKPGERYAERVGGADTLMEALRMVQNG